MSIIGSLDYPIITISPESVEKVNNYIQGREDNGDYDYYKRNRNAKGLEAAKRTDAGGKTLEFAFSDHYYNNTGKRIEPDCEIRKAPRKGWPPDFIIDVYKIHAKACLQSIVSWLIQLANKNGKGGRDPLLDSDDPNDIMVLGTVEHNTVKILWIVPWITVKPYLEDPYVPSNIRRARAIYHSTAPTNKGVSNLIASRDKIMDDAQKLGIQI